MLRRSPNASAVAGVTAFLFICIMTWSMRSSTINFSSKSDGVQSSSASRQSRGERVEDLGQRILTESAPRVALPPDSSNLKDIQNATLGFQKIFILSMPYRSDKRDQLALSAYMSGLDIEFIDGPNASLISEKAYPYNWKPDGAPGTLGCWRGHMDIYRRMVQEKIYSAMIMEDDVDWDVMIKAQMTEVARGARYLQRGSASPNSPYGDNWDLLVTGHCGMWNKVGEDQEYWVIKDDPTVIPPSQRKWWRKPNLTPPALQGNHTRVVLSPYHFSCTGSYAISLSGAARALYDQAVMPNAKEIDMGLGGICKRHEYGFSTCLGTYPMITGIHHQIGNAAKDSDRKDISAKRPDRKFASSDNLVYPVRLNIGKLLMGETIVKAQTPQLALLPEMDISTLELPRGSPVFVKKDQYQKEEPQVNDGDEPKPAA